MNKWEKQCILSSNGFNYRIIGRFVKWPWKQTGFVVNDVCVDTRDDTLYVAVREAPEAVCVFDKNGEFIRAFGGGMFTMAHGMCITDYDTLLVADAGEFTVIREFTLDGKLIRNFGKEKQGSDTGYTKGFDSIKRRGEPFNRPTQMIQGRDRYFYASDGYRNAAIHKFDLNGNYLKSWGGPGTKEGEFMLPHCIQMDKLNRLWICDRENERVQIFDTEGNILKILDENLARPSEVWITDDYIVVGELDTGFTIFDYNYQKIAEFVFIFRPFDVHGICGDSKGNLYIATLGNYYNGLLKLEKF